MVWPRDDLNVGVGKVSLDDKGKLEDSQEESASEDLAVQQVVSKSIPIIWKTSHENIGPEASAQPFQKEVDETGGAISNSDILEDAIPH